MKRLDQPTRIELNGKDVSEYRLHPRMVELQIINIFLGLVREYGMYKAETIMKGLAEAMNIDWQKITGIIRNVNRFITQKKKDVLRYRQEMIFLGELWGYSRLHVAEQFLGISHTTLYKDGHLTKPEHYVTEEWLAELANSVVICGIEAYRLEGIKFMESFFNFVKVLGYVSVSKISV
jgi:hypothetical protein